VISFLDTYGSLNFNWNIIIFRCIPLLVCNPCKCLWSSDLYLRRFLQVIILNFMEILFTLKERNYS
jgi:hypothetical protein